jgi:hypothetical protein
MPEEGPAEDEDADVYEEDEGVTEIALSQLADRSGGSLEDVAVRVDPDSAYAARDRALQEHMERRERLRQELPTVPWDPSRRITFGHRPDSVVAKEARAKKALPRKKAAKKKALAKKAVAKKMAASKPRAQTVTAEALAIEDYDDLTAAEILSVLDQLDDDELDLVAEYEEQHQNRAEVLDAVDGLLGEEGGPPGAPAGAAPAKEAPAKEAPAKKAPAKKAPPKKKAAAKKAPAKKKAAAKKAPAKRAGAEGSAGGLRPPTGPG